MTKRKKLLTVAFIGLVTAAVALAEGAYTSIQVTLGSGATEIATTQTWCLTAFVQNNAAHDVRFGDSTVSATKGILLVPGSSLTLPPSGGRSYDLSQFYLYGTSGDVIDVGCQAPY